MSKEQFDKSRQEATRISNRELANEVWREFYERRAGMSADEEKQEFLTLVTAAFTRSHVVQNWRYIPANPPPKDTPIELLCADGSVARVDYYDGYGRFHDNRLSNAGGIFWRPVSVPSTTPQKRLAAWVDGVCKTCGQYTHSCKCEHPGRDFMKRLFAAPQEGAASPAGPATNGEPAAAASWLDTIPTAADGVTCHIRDVRRAFALSATPCKADAALIAACVEFREWARAGGPGWGIGNSVLFEPLTKLMGAMLEHQRVKNRADGGKA